MELKNDFRVGVPPETAWRVFNDIERIAPCMPGAQLQEIEGDEFRGIVKVKVGPITAQYKGKATFLEQDEAAGRVVLKASGRDVGGGGNANATITAVMVADGDGTRVSVVTDLAVTGRLAQFGRGVLTEVSTKLLGQFVECLERRVLTADAEAEAEAAPPAAAPAPAPPGDNGRAAVPETGAGTATATQTEVTPPPVRRFEGPDVEPVDLLDAAGSSLAKRLVAPLAAGALVLAVVIWRRRHHR